MRRDALDRKCPVGIMTEMHNRPYSQAFPQQEPAMIQSMPHPIRGSSRLRALFVAALVPVALSACAPDAWKNNPNYDAFVNQILRNCGNKNMGELTVADLMNQDNSTFSAYFYDLTARWGQNRISTADYVQGVMSVGGGRESAGLKCIVAQKGQ